MPAFKQLNHGWNAEPNAPAPIIRVDGSDLVLQFYLNPFGFKQFEEEDVGFLRFHDCLRYRLGPTNDEGWYRGQCRYGRSAPKWGEFYELTGYDPQLDQPTDWVTINGCREPLVSRLLRRLASVFGVPPADSARHFLFYLRDDTFECIASGWSFDPDPSNALRRVLGPREKE
jgi:hypothetical protein